MQWCDNECSCFLIVPQMINNSLYFNLRPSSPKNFCLSVCLSVLLFHHFHNIRLIVSSGNSQESLPMTEGYAKGRSQRSKVKVTEVKIPFRGLRTVTPVWMCLWWWNDAQSLMLFRRGTLLFSKVIRQQGHIAKQDRRLWPNLGVYGL